MDEEGWPACAPKAGTGYWRCWTPEIATLVPRAGGIVPVEAAGARGLVPLRVRCLSAYAVRPAPGKAPLPREVFGCIDMGHSDRDWPQSVPGCT